MIDGLVQFCQSFFIDLPSFPARSRPARLLSAGIPATPLRTQGVGEVIPAVRTIEHSNSKSLPSLPGG